MPKVGKRSFAYTKKGKVAAKKFAKSSGMKAGIKKSGSMIPPAGPGKG